MNYNCHDWILTVILENPAIKGEFWVVVVPGTSYLLFRDLGDIKDRLIKLGGYKYEFCILKCDFDSEELR